MVGLRDGKSKWFGVLASALVAAPLATLADDNGKKPVAEVAVAAKDKAKERAEAQAIRKDFLELAGSLDKTKEKGKGKAGGKGNDLTDAEVLAKTQRPPRVVHKTTFDAAGVDALLEESLRTAKVKPADVTGDEEFIRRVTLDVVGKLPTPEQVIAFRKNRDKNKRAMLIDGLLKSEDYARNWARYFRDVVQYHATADNRGLVNFPNMEAWLTEQFAKNKPWDEIATAMITATGNTGETGSPALIAAHQGQAVELAGEVSRVFLGVQIQCAQCHDHPSDQWKREQFHEFAAFFGGIAAKNMNQKQSDIPGVLVSDKNGIPAYKMPDLKDPQKQIPVSPKFFLAASENPVPANLTSVQRRMLAASYVTGQDNPWFAKAFVNRVWTSLLGDGFYNPVDDIGPTRTAHATEVLDALAMEWQKGGYDVRWLFRTILNTQAYQRQFRSVNTAAGKTPFAANCPSRLRADQIIDALGQALKIDFIEGGPMGKAAEKKAANAAANPRAKIQRNGLNLLFGVDPSIPSDDILGTIPQALFLMNSQQIDRAIRGDNKAGVLSEIIATSPNERVALEALYLRVLARSPTLEEVRTCGKYLEKVGNHREGFEDILWALINSTEFLSRK